MAALYEEDESRSMISRIITQNQNNVHFMLPRTFLSKLRKGNTYFKKSNHICKHTEFSHQEFSVVSAPLILIYVINIFIVPTNKKVYVCYVYSGSSNVSLVLLTTPNCQGTEPASLHHYLLLFWDFGAQIFSILCWSANKNSQGEENQCARALGR